MKNIEKICMLLLMATISMEAIGTASATVNISISPSQKNVNVNDTFSLDIAIDPEGASVAGVQTDINFNSSILQALSVTEGNFLSRGGPTFFRSGTIDNTNGIISGIADAALYPAGQNTSGIFATMNFKAVSNGTSDIIINNLLVSNPDGNPLPSSVNNGTVKVGQSIINSINLTKIASPTNYSAVGQIINYTYNITNTGNSILSGTFAVNDNQTGTIDPCGSVPLNPGDSTSCTANYIIKQSDIDNGSVTNSATVSGNGLNAGPVTTTVIAEQKANISLTKTASPTNYSIVGENITYTYNITNTGNTVLSGPFTLTDNITGIVNPCGSGPLNPGSSTSCTSRYTIKQSDIDNGSVTNSATVSGNGLISNEADKTINLERLQRSMSITKTALPTNYSIVGQNITYTYNITNTGDTILSGPFVVDDNQTGIISPCGSGPLNPGSSTSCTSKYTIKQSDIDNGSVTNSATVSGDGLVAGPVTTTVTAIQISSILLAKNASPTTYSIVGENITYMYTITDNGNTIISGPFSVNDNQTGIISPCGSGPLNPGNSTSCTTNYVIKQSDIDNGSVTNSATASGNGLTSNEANTTINVERVTQSLSLIKSASPTTYSIIGQNITYTYNITNTGNNVLSGPFAIDDNQTGLINPCGSGPLLPGESTLCTSVYTIKQSDIDNGSVTNSATASGNGLTAGPVTTTVTAIPPPLSAGSISGKVINVNTDTGVSNVKISLTKTGAGIKMSNLTNSLGIWKFENLSAGKYTIKEDLPKGFTSVSPTIIRVTIANGQNSTDNNFLIKPRK